MRSIYHSLTGDQSGARTTAEEEMDQRVSEALMMEDPEIIMDLRQLNTNGKDSFGVFWDKCSEYLSACTSVTFMAKAISVRDLIEEVKKLCPTNIPIPSESWVRLNFCPRNPHTQAAKRYTGMRLHQFDTPQNCTNV